MIALALWKTVFFQLWLTVRPPFGTSLFSQWNCPTSPSVQNQLSWSQSYYPDACQADTKTLCSMFWLAFRELLPTEWWHLPKFTMNLRADFSVPTLGMLQKTFSILHRIKGASLNGKADGNIPGSNYSTASDWTLLPHFSWGGNALGFLFLNYFILNYS